MWKSVSRLQTDMLFVFLCIILVMFLSVLLWVNDPGKEAKKEDRARAGMVVQLIWGPTITGSDYKDTDVDLWVKGPADVGPVGYLSKNGTQFSLLRDIVGTFANLAPFNQELAVSEPFLLGEYTINVVLFSARSAPLPIPYTVVVTTSPPDGRSKDVLSWEGQLNHDGEEQTVFNFKLREDGSVTDVNRVHRPLFTGR